MDKPAVGTYSPAFKQMRWHINASGVVVINKAPTVYEGR